MTGSGLADSAHEKPAGVPVQDAAARPGSTAPASATPSSTTPALTVTHLAVERGGKPILSDIHFTLAPGEILGVIGANGAGKSTLLMSLCGQIAPTAGQIAFRPCAADADCAMAIGYAPQRSALYGRLTALENVTLFARLAGLKRADCPRAASAALEKVGAAALAPVPAERLSGGERQRVNIAAALVGGPAAIALDEPAANLDPSATRALGDLVGRLGREGQAVLLVTHDMDEAERICDRVMVLNRGRIAALDTPRRLIAQYTDGMIDVTLEVANAQHDPACEAFRKAGLEPEKPGVWRARAASNAAAFRLIQNLEAASDTPAITHAALSKPGLASVIAAMSGGTPRTREHVACA